MKYSTKLSLLMALLFLGMSNLVNAQTDFGNLERYAKANAALDCPKEYEQRVVFMGDSITEGWSQASPEFMANPAYVNRGIGGQTTPQMLIRFRDDVVNLRPDVVVIMAGINDIAQNTGPIELDDVADNLFSMVNIAQANSIKVVLCSVMPANNFPWREEIKPAQKVLKLNAMLKTFAQKEGLVYVDYHAATTNKEHGLSPDLASDGVHPTKKGYEIMERLVTNGINQAFAQ